MMGQSFKKESGKMEDLLVEKVRTKLGIVRLHMVRSLLFIFGLVRKG